MNDTKLENYTSFDDMVETTHLSDTTDDLISLELPELPVEPDDSIGWDWLIFG